MITVAILVNGHPVMARSASRISDGAKGVHVYRVDDGSRVQHRESEGAVRLAIKLLETIIE